MLLDAINTKLRIEEISKTSSRCWCFSAFATISAVSWIVNQHKYPGRLLIRGRPDDFLSGASSFEALGMALASGWDVKISSAIHVKVYFFDDSVVAGSGNLTGKGMALVPNNNDELNLEAAISSEDIKLAEHLWGQGVLVSERSLERMVSWLDEFDQQSDSLVKAPSSWPEEILPVESRDLYCSDFPQSPYSVAGDEYFQVSSFGALESKFAYLWLRNAVEQNAGKAYFGYLSATLHNSVYDDPVPYRREIKELLSNLLSYVSVFDDTYLIISRPNYSQLVELRS